VNEEKNEMLALLLADTIANTTVLRALVISHPDRAALLAAWHAVSAGQIAISGMQRIAQHDVAVETYLQERLATWQGRLEGSDG